MNYAELQKRINDGTISLAEAKRMGSTHKAYNWSPIPYGSWNTEQVNAYMEGYRNHDAGSSLS